MQLANVHFIDQYNQSNITLSLHLLVIELINVSKRNELNGTHSENPLVPCGRHRE
jgi:hypothetical protein